MSSIYHEVLGYFVDVPAIILVNGASSDFTVSLPFIQSCNLPCSVSNHNGATVESTSGPARVPTNGWFNSRQMFRPIYLSGYDVELSRDWIAFVNARFDGSRFLRPSESDLAQLGAGHTWDFDAGGTYVYLIHLHMSEWS